MDVLFKGTWETDHSKSIFSFPLEKYKCCEGPVKFVQVISGAAHARYRKRGGQSEKEQERAASTQPPPQGYEHWLVDLLPGS